MSSPPNTTSNAVTVAKTDADIAPMATPRPIPAEIESLEKLFRPFGQTFKAKNRCIIVS
jgi:hypothetical protein